MSAKEWSAPSPIVVPDETASLAGVFDSPVFVPVSKEVGRRAIHSLRHEKSARKNVLGVGGGGGGVVVNSARSISSSVRTVPGPTGIGGSNASLSASKTEVVKSVRSWRAAAAAEEPAMELPQQLPFDVPHTSPLLQYFKGEAGTSLMTVAKTLPGIRINPVVLTFAHPLRSVCWGLGLLQRRRSSSVIAPMPQLSTSDDSCAALSKQSSKKGPALDADEETRVHSIVHSFENNFRVRRWGGGGEDTSLQKNNVDTWRRAVTRVCVVSRGPVLFVCSQKELLRKKTRGLLGVFGLVIFVSLIRACFLRYGPSCSNGCDHDLVSFCAWNTLRHRPPSPVVWRRLSR